MAEYIDKARLYNTIAKLEEKARKHYLEDLESSVLSGNAERAFARLSERTAFKHLVADFRAADVVEVVHARWVHPHWIGSTSAANCSVCNFEAQHREYRGVEKFYKYCPGCNAIMDLED